MEDFEDVFYVRCIKTPDDRYILNKIYQIQKIGNGSISLKLQWASEHETYCYAFVLLLKQMWGNNRCIFEEWHNECCWDWASYYDFEFVENEILVELV